MATRPAIDSLMPSISGASWEPTNNHDPIRYFARFEARQAFGRGLPRRIGVNG